MNSVYWTGCIYIINWVHHQKFQYLHSHHKTFRKKWNISFHSGITFSERTSVRRGNENRIIYANKIFIFVFRILGAMNTLQKMIIDFYIITDTKNGKVIPRKSFVFQIVRRHYIFCIMLTKSCKFKKYNKLEYLFICYSNSLCQGETRLF